MTIALIILAAAVVYLLWTSFTGGERAKELQRGLSIFEERYFELKDRAEQQQKHIADLEDEVAFLRSVLTQTKIART